MNIYITYGQPHEISFIEFASPLHSTILTIETDWVSFSLAQTFSWKTGDYGSHELISLSCIRIKTSESLPRWAWKYRSCGIVAGWKLIDISTTWSQ
jgi:hypothetical protein